MKNESSLYVLDNIIHFGLDHLEVFGTCKYEKELFESLDFDNSNYWELEDYSFTKNEVPKYKYKIIFTKDNYSLFAYYKWDKDLPGIIKSKDKIVVYSTAFKLLSYEEIQYFLQWYFDLNKCYRFDVCLDINMDINLVLSDFNDLNTGTEFKKKWNIETRYIWESNKYRNKRQIIRVYNKILDITKKHKHKLYKEYLAEEYVTRLELEVRSELAKNVDYKELFNDDILSAIYRNYFKKYTKMFQVPWAKNISLYKKPLLDIDPEDYQSLVYKLWKRKLCLGHMKTIYNLWFCPVRMAIVEWLIQPKTQRMLWWDLIELLREKEVELKNQARENAYKRKVQAWLISDENNYG